MSPFVRRVTGRRRRWRAALLAALAALLVLPWIYVRTRTDPPGPVALPALDDSVRRTVFVVVWGYHSSIIVAQPTGWRLGPPGAEWAPYVEYAWGDRRFYMESNFWPHAVFAALFLPTESVSYVAGRGRPPTESAAARAVYAREYGGRELRALVTALEGEMRRTPDGARAAPWPETPEYAGRFYPARELYLFWSNCNTWTVRMLRDGGLPDLSAAGVMLPQQVGGRLVGFERVK